MYTVEIQNPCRCFWRSGLAEQQRFETKDEARAEAERLIGQMRLDFCQKHDFALMERFGNFVIVIRPR